MSSYDIRAAVENPETSATLLHTLCLATFGEGWYVWDPSTVYLELKDEWQADAPATNMDKLSAIQILVGSDVFFKDPRAFSSICSTLSDGDPLFDMFDPPSAEEISWSVAEASLNREMIPFSRHIKGFVKAICKPYGFTGINLPIPIRELLEGGEVGDDGEPIMAAVMNGENIDNYMREGITQMRAQFMEVPDVKGMFKDVMSDGVIDAVDKASIHA